VTELPRLRQAVLAARSLEPVVETLSSALGLGEPFSDPGVGHFGLRNAVFALGDTFLEVVSPVRDGTSAGRLLERRGGDCGYMLMFQVADLAAARLRDAPVVGERWRSAIGGGVGVEAVEVVEDPAERGLVEVRITGGGLREAFTIAGVRFAFDDRG
jgi:hypothetical protein